MEGTLFVVRDDREYDYKEGFETYAEANAYRCECQRSWMGHEDYVFYRDEDYCEYNLTEMGNDLESFCDDNGIPMK